MILPPEVDIWVTHQLNGDSQYSDPWERLEVLVYNLQHEDFQFSSMFGTIDTETDIDLLLKTFTLLCLYNNIQNARSHN